MNKRKVDEYRDIYGQYEGSGFIFGYSKGHLSRSKTVLKEDVDRIDPNKRSSDDTPLYVLCRPCESFMDFKAGSKRILDGYWQCPQCGIRVRERTIYSQLDRENIEFMNVADKNYDDDPDWL